MQEQVLSVSQINEYIRSRMDSDPLLSSVAVKGEISNYKLYPSGHHYFTVKDEGGALKCVMFKGNAMRLRFRPENGMQVIVMGRISVYPRDGAYQLYCTGMVLDGLGDLYTAFEQLKAKLQKLGLFDPAHKKPIPKYPRRIGLVTSSAGAAVHDMLRILRKRYPLAQVLLLPVAVQGVEAPPQIAGAIRYANAHVLADVLIVGRGGGSIEDLWAFNDEQVAYAVYESKIPVISAVGHEPDVTICDYVADLRAATPSNGAELAVPDQEALRQLLDSSLNSMDAAMTRKVNSARQYLNVLRSSVVLRDPGDQVKRKRQQLTILSGRLNAGQTALVEKQNRRFISVTAKLDALSPMKVLTRGYSIVSGDDGKVLRSVSQTRAGECLQITLSDGSVSATVTEVKENDHE